MGSSAASAAASAWAVNTLFGAPLSKEQLVIPGLTSEATVSGYHADNIAPALLGGFILIRCSRTVCKRGAFCKQHRAINIISATSYSLLPELQAHT